MRVAGGFNEGLRNDFLYNITRLGVDELDLSAVTSIDDEEIELCRFAVEKNNVVIGQMSASVRDVLGLDR